MGWMEWDYERVDAILSMIRRMINGKSELWKGLRFQKIPVCDRIAHMG